MNLLIVVPSFKILGGVANHYMGLHPHWTYYVKYCLQGKRTNLPAVVTLIPDFIGFILRLIFTKVDVVILNPSLRNYQLSRDSIYCKIARFFGKPVVTFIHGWDPKVAEHLIENPKKFLNSFGKSKFIYCLYSKFKEDLLKMGVKCPVYLTTTKVTDKLIEDYNIKTRTGKIKNLLFLARLEENKGIFILLDSYKILKEKYPDISLTICGTGSAETQAKEYVKKYVLKDVDFKGNVKGEKLIEAFKKADIYILPTTHGEGMATSILEAMAFGLPIISRPVGGVNDFFENGRMGYLIESLNPEDYAKYIEKLIQNPILTKDISFYNHEYAVARFLASKVTQKFEIDLSNQLYKNN